MPYADADLTTAAGKPAELTLMVKAYSLSDLTADGASPVADVPGSGYRRAIDAEI